MSLRYDELKRDPEAFSTFTGLPLVLFEAMLPDLLADFDATRARRLDRPGRARAIGGGDDYDLSPTDQLLLTLVHLKRVPTYGELAYHFGVSKATVCRAVARCLPALDAHARRQIRMPADEPPPESPTESPTEPAAGPRPRKKRRSPGLTHMPERVAVIDSFEQPIRRPKYQQKRYYSGKKKRHTLKVQLTVDEATGRILAVSGSVPGPVADIDLMRRSGVLGELPAGVGVMGDSAYQGMADEADGRACASPRRKPRGKDRPRRDRAFNRAVARRRVVVEHTIGRMKRFGVLATVFRHRRAAHGIRVRAVAGLVNRLMEHATAA